MGVPLARAWSGSSKRSRSGQRDKEPSSRPRAKGALSFIRISMCELPRRPCRRAIVGESNGGAQENVCLRATTAEVELSGSVGSTPTPRQSFGPWTLCRDDSNPACETTAGTSSTSFPLMRWLWVTLLLVSVLIACNSSNGSSCSSAGGVCVLASCSPYCLNGTCFTPLPESAGTAPAASRTLPASRIQANPCCLSAPAIGDSGATVPPVDAGQTTDAAVGADADAAGDPGLQRA